MDKLHTKLTELRQHILRHYRANHVFTENNVPEHVRIKIMYETYHKHARVADMVHSCIGAVIANVLITKNIPALHYMAILYG